MPTMPSKSHVARSLGLGLAGSVAIYILIGVLASFSTANFASSDGFRGSCQIANLP
jgi:hypothetical protein